MLVKATVWFKNANFIVKFYLGKIKLGFSQTVTVGSSTQMTVDIEILNNCLPKKQNENIVCLFIKY